MGGRLCVGVAKVTSLALSCKQQCVTSDGVVFCRALEGVCVVRALVFNVNVGQKSHLKEQSAANFGLPHDGENVSFVCELPAHTAPGILRTDWLISMHRVLVA